MVWLTFSFLLATPYIPIVEPTKVKKPAKKTDIEITAEEPNYVEMEVKKITFSCHIDYVIFPNQAPIAIDVISWGNVVKIYYGELAKSIIPLVINDISWIHFRIKHKLDIGNEDIPKFHQHVILLTISTDKKKLGQKAKSDKVKMFYGPKFDGESPIQAQLFQPLSEDPNTLYAISVNEEEMFKTNLELGPHAKSLKDYLFSCTREYHDGSKRVPTPKEDNDYPSLKNLKNPLKVVEPPTKKGAEKVPKGKPQPILEIQCRVPTELLLSGLNDFTNRVNYNLPDIPYFCSIARVKTILTREQAEFYNPLSITISHLKGMPVKELRKCGINRVKFQYDICGEIGVESKIENLASVMKLNYTRTVLTNNFDKLGFLEFLQTRGLQIEIFGVFESSENKLQPAVYNSENISSLTFSSSKKIIPVGMVLLGVADIDLSTLIYEPHRIVLKCNFRRPTKKVSENQPPFKSNFRAMNNINEINSFYNLRKDLNFCHYMTSSSAVMTVSVRLGYSLLNLLKTVEESRTYTLNRLLMVLYDFQLAVEILEVMQSEAKELIAPINYFQSGTRIKRPASCRYSLKKEVTDTLSINQATGFLVDCVDKVIVYVESSSIGLIQQVWMMASFITPIQGRVLYDSSLLFLSRLTEPDIQYGAFYVIALKERPSEILSKPRALVQGNIPVAAWKALTNLDQLSYCLSIKTACRDNLIPDSHSLCSMDIEFGVPLKLKEDYSERIA